MDELSKKDKSIKDCSYCSACKRFYRKSVGVLHKHHIVQKSKNGIDKNLNRLVLCANCHGIIHYFIKKYISENSYMYTWNTYKNIRDDLKSDLGEIIGSEYFKRSHGLSEEIDGSENKNNFADIASLIIKSTLIDNKYHFSKSSNIYKG